VKLQLLSELCTDAEQDAGVLPLLCALMVTLQVPQDVLETL
jgi:hypothetical protein